MEQLFHGVLGRLGFDFARGGHVRHQSQAHEQGMLLAADPYRHLTNRFEERQGFDIAYGTADFHQTTSLAFAARQYALFDSVGDVRDNPERSRPGSRHGALCAARRR